MYVLHLFSGQRRPGDLQYWLEREANSTQTNIVILSIDVVLDAARCDLQSPRAIAYWRDHILAGRIAAMFAGPPCDTWSRARALPTRCCNQSVDPGGICNACGNRLPRPLRGPLQLWGLPGLRKREHQALTLANHLYRSTIYLAVCCWRSGVPFVIEHPERPTEGHLPSSWKLPQTRLLASLQGVSTTSFDQCTMGGDHVKPTTLLFGHVDQLQSMIMARGVMGRCHHPGGAHGALRGLREGGGWRTAPAKTYPSTMCRVIGTAMVQAITTRWPWLVRSLADPDDDFMYFYQPLDPYADDWERFGADTYRPPRGAQA